MAQSGGCGVTVWSSVKALTLWPIACFFFGLVRLDRNVDGLHIQLLPWLETRSHRHNQSLWQDERPRLGNTEGI